MITKDMWERIKESIQCDDVSCVDPDTYHGCCIVLHYNTSNIVNDLFNVYGTIPDKVYQNYLDKTILVYNVKVE